jgi:outer membrane lipoprotein-sorting protein
MKVLDLSLIKIVWGNKKMKKILITILLTMGLLFALTGCEGQAQRVSQNLSQQADNFNVVRQLTVINCIQGDVIFQMTGKMSIKADTADKQLEVVVENSDGSYQKHFIGLSDNVTYVVEQKNFKNVDKYKYTLNYNPKMWIPVGLENVD